MLPAILEHAYTTQLFAVYLKLKLNWVSYLLSGKILWGLTRWTWLCWERRGVHQRWLMIVFSLKEREEGLAQKDLPLVSSLKPWGRRVQTARGLEVGLRQDLPKRSGNHNLRQDELTQAVSTHGHSHVWERAEGGWRLSLLCHDECILECSWGLHKVDQYTQPLRTHKLTLS